MRPGPPLAEQLPVEAPGPRVQARPHHVVVERAARRPRPCPSSGCAGPGGRGRRRTRAVKRLAVLISGPNASAGAVATRQRGRRGPPSRPRRRRPGRRAPTPVSHHALQPLIRYRSRRPSRSGVPSTTRPGATICEQRLEEEPAAEHEQRRHARRRDARARSPAREAERAVAALDGPPEVVREQGQQKHEGDETRGAGERRHLTGWHRRARRGGTAERSSPARSATI